MVISKSYVRKYWFGVDEVDAVANTVLLMERDRLEQYKAALDLTWNSFQGVFAGLTGLYNGRRLSVVYSRGPAHVADCVSFLAYGFGVRCFFSTGSVGGLATEMGDIVISNACATQDAFSYASYPDEVRYEQPLGYTVEIKMPQSLTLSDAIRHKLKEAFDCDIKYGAIFTVPAVSLEDDTQLNEIKNRGYVAVDLETGPFLAACQRSNAQGVCIHWVTDLPLERSFYYQYDGAPEIIRRDKEKKHRQWLNMPRLILPIVDDLVKS